MNETKIRWKIAICKVINNLLKEMGIETSISKADIVAEVPPRPELGDLAFPLYQFAKVFKSAPQKIATQIAQLLQEFVQDAEVVTHEGPYINVFLNRAQISGHIIDGINRDADGYGSNNTLKDKKIMIEFSCPNTNKPLHLGHLRNGAIGESVSQILKSNGATVQKVNLINNRGIHICKSMLAYQMFGDGKTPESERVKGDHFVGDYYVRYSSWAKEHPEAEDQVRQLLRQWEDGDKTTIALWQKMNDWTLEGIDETYRRMGTDFDVVYFESETYQAGREEILKGLDQGVFYKKEDGSIWIDLTEFDLDQKLLLRADSTSVYITQDIGTAIARHRNWPFERLIFVVAAEQEYHFTVFFHVLTKLGYKWAKDLHHLSYGMVNLPDGRMKSREGTIIDADDLIDELTGLAEKEILSKERENDVDDLKHTAEMVCRGAVNYYLLQVSSRKDMIFDPAESIAFNGNTGPYLQYAGARINNMLGKYAEREDKFADGKIDTNLIAQGDEWEIIKQLSLFPEAVQQAAEELNPAVITSYLYTMAKMYSRYYHDNPVLHNENSDLVQTRISISRCVLQVLKNGFRLTGIPFLKKM